MSIISILQENFVGFVSGTTRAEFDSRQVTELKYEAYRPMAEQKLATICAEIRDHWDVVHICVMHRIGLVQSVSFVTTLALIPFCTVGFINSYKPVVLVTTNQGCRDISKTTTA